MNNLECTYLGLNFRNPLIVSSSGLTSSLEKLKRLDEAGAGAVVLKSVFEEQIINETSSLENYSDYTEASDYLSVYLKEEYINKYISLIAEAKKALPIPVIGSINCISVGEWIDYARRIEKAGADAIELNIFLLPADREQHSDQIEQHYLKIVKQVADTVAIPVSVKVGSRFTNLLGMVKGIEHRGAKGVVMFNRFYEPDINIEAIVVTEADIFSTPSELRNAIRWIGMASAEFKNLDFAASMGVHSGESAVKALLAGAAVYEVCTAIYEHGMGAIREINDFVAGWMERKGFSSVAEFKGKLNYANVKNPIAFERSQFMKYYSSHE